MGSGLNQLSIITGKTYSRENKPGREKLTQLCMAYLANFARSGNPNGGSLPKWEPWNPAQGTPKLIILDAGLSDLRISESREMVSRSSVTKLIKSELTEPKLSEILKILSGPFPFGIGK